MQSTMVEFPNKLIITNAINLAKQRASQLKKIMWVLETKTGVKVLDSHPLVEATKYYKIWPSGKIDVMVYPSSSDE
jgi:hypothetical protein